MHDEGGFLAAIRQTPADDTARLVFADWLDEQDDPTSKTKAAFIRLELQMVEAPEKSLNRTRWLYQLQKLAVTFEPGWLAAVSHPKLEGCRVSFQFECPKQWDRLTPTDDTKVRFCDACKKNVHYCNTLQEAQNHAANGTCVAITLALVRKPHFRPPQPPPPRILAAPRFRRLPPYALLRFSVAGRLTPLTVIPPPPPQTSSPPPAEPMEPEREPQPSRPRLSKKSRKRHRNIQREDWEETE